MILYYCPGEGFGHLIRAKAVLHTFGILSHNVIIVSQNTFIDRIFEHTAYQHEIIPDSVFGHAGLLAQWLEQLMNKYHVKTLFADTFITGIRQEFYHLTKTVDVVYFARILKAEFLPEFLPGKINIQHIYILESLPTYQLKYLHDLGVSTSKLKIEWPQAVTDKMVLANSPYAVAVHSGPLNELLQLIEYTTEILVMKKIVAPILVISPHRLDTESGLIYLNTLYAESYFSNSLFIVTACGFNSMMQASPYAHKHYYIPFARKFDDQYVRAQLYRENC